MELVHRVGVGRLDAVLRRVDREVLLVGTCAEGGGDEGRVRAVVGVLCEVVGCEEIVEHGDHAGVAEVVVRGAETSGDDGICADGLASQDSEELSHVVCWGLRLVVGVSSESFREDVGRHKREWADARSTQCFRFEG